MAFQLKNIVQLFCRCFHENEHIITKKGAMWEIALAFSSSKSVEKHLSVIKSNHPLTGIGSVLKKRVYVNFLGIP